MLGCGIGTLGSTINRLRHRHRLERGRRAVHRRPAAARSSSWSPCLAAGILFVMRYAGAVKARSGAFAGRRPARGRTSRISSRSGGDASGCPSSPGCAAHPDPLRADLRDHDLGRDQPAAGGWREMSALFLGMAIIVCSGKFAPGWTRTTFVDDLRQRRARPARRRADHRRRPRHRRGDGRGQDHRHDPVLRSRARSRGLGDVALHQRDVRRPDRSCRSSCRRRPASRC